MSFLRYFCFLNGTYWLFSSSDSRIGSSEPVPSELANGEASLERVGLTFFDNCEVFFIEGLPHRRVTIFDIVEEFPEQIPINVLFSLHALLNLRRRLVSTILRPGVLRS